MSYSYHQPTTLDDVLKLRAEQPEARIIAGGTDLLVQLDQGRFAAPPALISLRRVEELAVIEMKSTTRVGSTASLTSILGNADLTGTFPALKSALEVLGSQQIRNVASLGGNLCNGSPAADSAVPLLCYEAEVELRNRDGLRTVPLGEFFKGPGKTVIKADEIMTAVLLPPAPEDFHAVFMRKGRVKMDLALASLSVGCCRHGDTLTHVRIAAGAVGPMPTRLPETEALLETHGMAGLTEACILAAEEISPIDDIRTSAAYRRTLIRVFLERSIATLDTKRERAA